MDYLDALAKAWPILVGFIALIYGLSKMDIRIKVLEEKVHSLFELWNKK
jgi:hypothetical protein